MPPADTTLIVRHLPGREPAAFQLTRLSDNKSAQPVELPSPFGFPVEGRPDSDLMRELRWYLEEFLDYPFPPEADHAERVQQALRGWGKEAFESLLGGRAGARMFDAAVQDDYAQLHLQIASDDAHVLAWPWEALFDHEIGSFLAQACRIERRLDGIRDPRPIPKSLPRDRVNILLVVARPYKRDVRYRSIARLLVELIEKHKLPAQVDLLRPPTFDQLREHLRKRPGYYHILHFDGHGAYGPNAGNDRHRYSGSEGRLVFEDEDGSDDPVSAEKLNTLLRDYAVPAVVLNACQSAMLDERAQDPFASVATALLRSGVRSVVAMAYSLYVSGGQQFLPDFYRRLFESGSMAAATRAGRHQMLAHPERVCARGEFPLDDWVLPVLYQQAPLDFSFAGEQKRTFAPRTSKVPEEASTARSPHGFIGRDSALLELERAMQRPPPAILVEGLGGVGKTTLARGFLEWLDQTNGLGEGAFWFTFQEIRSAEYVFNRMGEALFGGQFGALAMDQKIDALTKVFVEKRFVIVWDNFEVAKGIPNTAVSANLSEDDRELLKRFLDKLRGGASKVIITSRSSEDWLGGTEQRFRLRLGGLDGEERWEYCTAVLRDLGRKINRQDEDLAGLMNLLGGHPLAMRVILPRLEKQTAGQVAAGLKSNLAGLGDSGDEAERKLFATLQFVEESLPEELRELLLPLGMHEGYVYPNFLEAMAKSAGGDWSRARIDELTEALEAAGLLWDVGQNIYQMHPLLTSFLRSRVVQKAGGEARDRWVRAFVDVMGSVADQLAPRPLHEQRFGFHVHGASFHYALGEAERLGMGTDFAALTQSLAFFAQNTRNFAEADRLFEGLAEHHRKNDNAEWEAVAYHQLGMVAKEQRDFAEAEQWYRKSLAIEEKQGNELGAARSYHTLGTIALERRKLDEAADLYHKAVSAYEKHSDENLAAMGYHQLGIIAEEQRDFAAAEQWYRKSLAIMEKQGDEHGAAMTYHQLGTIALEQRDFAAAEQWYRKSLAIEEKQGNEHGAASTYHQLGRNAEEQRDFAAAEQWYRKSLAIKEKQGNEHGAANTYHQLGIIAGEQRDFAAAEQWYRKSLAIKEKQGDEHGAAGAYHQLGRIAQQQRDFAAAEQWYRKSLLINEKQGNEHGAASTYCQLGVLAAAQERFRESGEWLIEGLKVFLRANDANNVQQAASVFLVTYGKASDDDKAELRRMWEQAGVGPFPEQGREAGN